MKFFTRSVKSTLKPPNSALDERPTAQRDDCLWLLRLSPDQIHSSPSRGPLIEGRAGGPIAEKRSYVLRSGGPGVKGVKAAHDSAQLSAGWRFTPRQPLSRRFGSRARQVKL